MDRVDLTDNGHNAGVVVSLHYDDEHVQNGIKNVAYFQVAR